MPRSAENFLNDKHNTFKLFIYLFDYRNPVELVSNCLEKLIKNILSLWTNPTFGWSLFNYNEWLLMTVSRSKFHSSSIIWQISKFPGDQDFFIHILNMIFRNSRNGLLGRVELRKMVFEPKFISVFFITFF